MRSQACALMWHKMNPSTRLQDLSFKMPTTKIIDFVAAFASGNVPLARLQMTVRRSR